MIDIISAMIKKFLPFAKERMGFKDPPRLFLKGDSTNAENPLGKTAFYSPGEKAITVYITGRHPKDVMRSLSHELVHHTQNCRGDFEHAGEMGEGYAQNDEHLREMEREAYEVGNLCFRDWEDSIKSTIYFEHLQKGDKKMSIKDWKNGEIKTLLSEAWGFKMDLSKLAEVHKHGLGHVKHPADIRPATDEEEEELEEGDVAYNRDDDEEELEELAQAKQRGERRKPHGAGKRVEDEPEAKDEEEELEELAGAKRIDRGRKGRPMPKPKPEAKDEEEELEESPSHPAADREGNRATGRRVKKSSGERLAEEDKEALKEILVKALRKHF
jgi:hypothetical protein